MLSSLPVGKRHLQHTVLLLLTGTVPSGAARITQVKASRCSTAAHSPNVIRPLMISGDFCMSLMAAMGRPQLATGPQKCYKNERRGRSGRLRWRCGQLRPL